MRSDFSLKSQDQPGKVANPARGQLNRENEYFPVPLLYGMTKPVASGVQLVTSKPSDVGT